MVILLLKLISIVTLLSRAVVSDESRKLITGGGVAVDRYPYFTRIPQLESVHCGGSLIAPDMVLTSALCLSIDQNLVTVGWRRGVFEETAVVGTFVHPIFAGNENNLDYAFAIVQLETSSSSDIVQLNSDPAVPDNETELGILGSGFDSTLNEADVFALTDEECTRSKNLAGFPMQVGASQMCAGDGVGGFCADDWGGPLVIRANLTDTTTLDDDTDVQVGVAAWSLCGAINPASPGVYLRVSDAYEWIRATVCDNSNAPPPDYLDCPNSVQPQLPLVPPGTAPQSPVAFRYDIFNDFFLFEVGIVVEKITGVNEVEIVKYVAPGSLLPQTVLTSNTDLSNDILLESGALYSFLMVDGEGDGLSTANGLETLSDAIVLFLQNANGNFQRIEGQVGGFSYRTSHLFYASLGVVQDAFYSRTTYPGNQIVNVKIIFDEYPWEIGMELRSSDGTRIWWLPPRFYEVPGATVTERISIPDVSDTYTFTIGDTNGDGLGSGGTGVTLTDRAGDELGATPFDTGSSASITFEYNPESIGTAIPTSSPTMQKSSTSTPTMLPPGETFPPITPTESPIGTPDISTPTPAPVSSACRAKTMLSVASLFAVFVILS
eukprot:scaffold3849_cov179-Amphora_coffeaeformis.AAC.17